MTEHVFIRHKHGFIHANVTEIASMCRSVLQ